MLNAYGNFVIIFKSVIPYIWQYIISITFITKKCNAIICIEFLPINEKRGVAFLLFNINTANEKQKYTPIKVSRKKSHGLIILLTDKSIDDLVK